MKTCCVVVAAGVLALAAAAPAPALVVDASLTDTLADATRYDGGTVTWVSDIYNGSFGPLGWYATDGGNDLRTAPPNEDWGDQQYSMMLTGNTPLLNVTIRNDSGVATFAGNMEGITLTWYDATEFTGSGLGGIAIQTKYHDLGSFDLSIPVIPAGQTHVVTVDLSVFLDGAQAFGDAGDGLTQLRIRKPMQNIWNWAEGQSVTDLHIIDVRLTPDPASLLLLVGGLAMAAIRRR